MHENIVVSFNFIESIFEHWFHEFKYFMLVFTKDFVNYHVLLQEFEVINAY